MSLLSNAKISSLFQLAASSPKLNRRYQTSSGTFSIEKPTKVKVVWARYKDHRWCRLNSLNLEKVRALGVFVIWQPNNGHVICIGQGNIASNLQTLRNSPVITKFGDNLLVSWARLPEKYRDGAVKYLYEQFSPKIISDVKNVPLVYLNLPGKT